MEFYLYSKIIPCKALVDKNRKISKRQLSILRGKNDELESGSINLFGGREVSTEAHVPTPLYGQYRTHARRGSVAESLSRVVCRAVELQKPRGQSPP